MNRASFAAVSLAALALMASAAEAGVIHGQIDVVQNDGENNAASVTITTPVASPGFSVRGGNRGDIDLGFEMTYADGIVMSVPRQNGRDNDAAGGNAGTPFGGIRYGTTAIDKSGTNAWFIPTFNASMTVPATDTTAAYTEQGGQEFNINVAAAYFTYDQYLGGRFTSTGPNGSINDQLASGNSQLVVGTHVIDPSGTTASESGRTQIDFRTLNANSRTGAVLASSATGILLVTGGKNEDNYAMSRANDDGTFTVFSHDNGSNGASFERDYVAFVYLAANDPNAVAMGRVLNEGTTVPGTGSGDYTITKGPAGHWYLAIAGQDETSGTLIVSPEGNDTGNTIDNILSYEWDPANSRWVIQTRDLPGPNLQDAGAGVPVFSFAFFSVPEPAALGLVAPLLTLALKRRRRVSAI